MVDKGGLPRRWMNRWWCASEVVRSRAWEKDLFFAVAVWIGQCIWSEDWSVCFAVWMGQLHRDGTGFCFSLSHILSCVIQTAVCMTEYKGHTWTHNLFSVLTLITTLWLCAKTARISLLLNRPILKYKFTKLSTQAIGFSAGPLEWLLSPPTNFNCILDNSSLMSTLKSANRD